MALVAMSVTCCLSNVTSVFVLKKEFQMVNDCNRVVFVGLYVARHSPRVAARVRNPRSDHRFDDVLLRECHGALQQPLFHHGQRLSLKGVAAFSCCLLARL